MSSMTDNPTSMTRRTFLARLTSGTLAAGTLAHGSLGCGDKCPETAKDAGSQARDARKVPTTSAAEDRPRVFMPDVHHENANGRPNWQLLANDSRFFGAILKVTQGPRNYVGVPWFLKNWPALRAAGGDEYGNTWFRGSYHYLEVAQSGAVQADYFLRTVEQAGGWGIDDLPPAVDVEQGSNEGATRSQVLDATSEWAETVKTKLGCKVMLYGHTLMRDLNITSHMGCDYLWAPQYNDALTDNEDIGWPDNLVAFWQYTDGSDHSRTYPTSGHRTDLYESPSAILAW